MKFKRLAAVAAACVVSVACVATMAACGKAEVEKSYWSMDAYVDTSNGAALDVDCSYTLNVSGDNYQFSVVKRTTMDIWIDIPYYSVLFGTCSVTENADAYVYTLNAPTRAIYANGQIEAVTSSIEPIMYDSANTESWPESLDGENATTKEAIITHVFNAVLGNGNASTITVTVVKAGGVITNVDLK